MDPLLSGQCRVDLPDCGEPTIEVGRGHPVGCEFSTEYVVIDQPVVHLWSFHEELPEPVVVEVAHQLRYERPVFPQVVGFPQEHDALVG